MHYMLRSQCALQMKSAAKSAVRKLASGHYQAILNTKDAIDRSKWRKLIKDVWWSGWVWVGECFFLVPAYPGSPRPKAVKRLCVCVSLPRYNKYYTYEHTHTHLFNSPLSKTTWVSRYQKGKTNLISLKQETVSGIRNAIIIFPRTILVNTVTWYNEEEQATNQESRQPSVDALNGKFAFTNNAVDFFQWVHIVRVCQHTIHYEMSPQHILYRTVINFIIIFDIRHHYYCHHSVAIIWDNPH